MLETVDFELGEVSCSSSVSREVICGCVVCFYCHDAKVVLLTEMDQGMGVGSAVEIGGEKNVSESTARGDESKR